MQHRRPPDFDLLDAAELLEFLAHVFGFWLFLFSPRFRALVLARWRARRGLQHARTAWEIGVATGCAAILTWALWPSSFYFRAESAV